MISIIAAFYHAARHNASAEVFFISIGLSVCRAVNRRFKLPAHPFNLRNESGVSYAQWQYERGGDTIRFYSKYASPSEMFSGKQCLDIGCGAGGKTMYYAGLGAARIIGAEILGKYKQEAEALAESLGFSDRFSFVCCDAAHMPIEQNSIDTIIMNDAMEHVGDPAAVLAECRRVLRPGGRLYVNFPPYNHPFGAHLSDLIGIPWVHVFFSTQTLIKLYKELAASLPDGEERIKFRISEGSNGPYFSYINRMTLRRFGKLAKNCNMEMIGYDEIPLRPFLTPLARLPGFREFFVKMAVAVFQK